MNNFILQLWKLRGMWLALSINYRQSCLIFASYVVYTLTLIIKIICRDRNRVRDREIEKMRERENEREKEREREGEKEREGDTQGE